MKWTVARFPDGSWTTGGKPTDSDYANCEVYVIDAPDRKTATRRASETDAAETRRRTSPGDAH